jgi:hypothetical protein
LINVYNFTWKAELSAANLPEPRMLAGKPDTGFIAQELSGAWPYAISPIGSRNLLANDSTTYARVNPAKVIPLVMAAVKDMSTIIEQLSSKV